jgi:hypothetical protein
MEWAFLNLSRYTLFPQLEGKSMAKGTARLRKPDAQASTSPSEEKFEIAKRAVVQIGRGGRGFVVNAGESRFVITAAHCLPFDRLPTPHLANSVPELTFPKIIGRLGSKRQTIWGELCAFSLTDDVAVFSEPDGELGDQWEKFAQFTEAGMMIGKPPDAVEPYKWETTPGMAAWVLSLAGEWQPCTVHNAARFLRITNHGSNHIEGGMSGEPIIDANGAAIGLISTGDGEMNPSLLDCLPPWLLRKLDVA